MKLRSQQSVGLVLVILISNMSFAMSKSSVPSVDTNQSVETKAELLTPETVSPLTGRVWRKPDFTGQENALGWKAGTFSIPPGLESRVAFWIDIYTKYSTQEGLLHDSEYLWNVYEVMDFSDIEKDPDLGPVQKEKRKEKRIKQAKEKYRGILRKLALFNGKPEELTPEELKIWQMYEKVNDADKFAEAADKSRVRFQLGQKDRFQQGVFYSGRYLEEMEKIFTNENVPRELIRLVFVESSFNVFARSRVGASGLWQIMRSASRRQLKIDQAVDERNHPLIATRLAAKILRNNYNMLGSWPLAIMAYNHGPFGVKKLVNKMGTEDVVELIENGEKKRFKFASKNFYASFLAALEVEQNANKYFSNLKWDYPLDKTEIRLSSSIKYDQVLRWFDGNRERADQYNPHLTKKARKDRVLIPKGTILHIPGTTKETVKN